MTRARLRERAVALASLLPSAGREYVHDYALYFAGAVVYYAVLSVVPLIVLGLAGIGWLLRLSEMAAAAEQRFLQQIDVTFGDGLRANAQELLEQLEQGSTLATLAGLIGLLLTASALFRHLRMTFRAIWKYEPPLAAGSLLRAVRATLMERVVAFAILLGGGALLVAMLITVAALQWTVARVRTVPLLGDTLLWTLALPTSILLASFSFGLLYKSLVPVRLRWREVRLAAALAGIAWIGGTELMTLYAARAVDGPTAYGAIGGVLMLMLWMHWVSKVLFFGAELCKVTADANINNCRTLPASPRDRTHGPGRAAGVRGSSAD